MQNMTFEQLKRYWHIELLGGTHKRFTWRRLREKYRQRSRYRYLFWFRFAQYLHSSRFGICASAPSAWATASPSASASRSPWVRRSAKVCSSHTRLASSSPARR